MRSALATILLVGHLAACGTATRSPSPPAPPAPGTGATQPAPVLDGPGGQHRVLRVEMHEAVFDGRYVQARDAQGMVEIRVTPRLCRQDGSATADPYTARLTIEGSAPLMGCGQPLQ